MSDHVRPRITSKGALILEKDCVDCGAPHASFGENVHLLLALKRRSEGRKKEAIRLLGQWRCYRCWEARKSVTDGASRIPRTHN